MWLCRYAFAGNPCNMTSQTEIDSRLGLCNSQINSTLVAYPTYADYYDSRILNMLFVELVPFVLVPSACLLGLYFNLKIISTIEENKKKVLKEDFYKYMSANAKFNCIYCLIFVFYPMTSCNWKLSTTFCSSIFTTQFVQYYKIVMMAYFGEVIKLSANVSYLMMTLNRYLLVGKDHAQWLVAIAKLEFKWVIRGCLLISALLNIGHCFEYQAVEDLALTHSFLNTYALVNDNSYSDYPLANQGQAYFIYSICYFSINFGFFFLLNTGIEVQIVHRMHTELKEKRERMAKLRSFSLLAGTESNVLCDLNEKKKEEEDGKKERKVVKMVILNSILNFVLRAPDLLFWMENENLWPGILKCHGQSNTQGQIDCIHNSIAKYLPGILSFIVDIAYFTYILTFTSNFFIFYKFNENFKKVFVFFTSSTKSKSKNSH
jgi:hypothetical protein